MSKLTVETTKNAYKKVSSMQVFNLSEKDFEKLHHIGEVYYRYDDMMYKGEHDIKQRKHGIGVCISDCGGLYEGEFHLNEIHGYGRLVNFEGEYYEGYWKNNIKNGYGKYYHLDQRVYIGEWKND